MDEHDGSGRDKTRRLASVGFHGLTKVHDAIAIQVNGKLRASINISSELDKEAIFSEALKDANVARHVEEKTIRKQIYVPDRLVNFVVG